MPNVLAGGMSDTLVLRLEQKPWTLNAERSNRRGHWNRAEQTRDWRGAFHLLALEAGRPHFTAVTVTVKHELKNRAAMPDTGSCIGAAKAAIDGLVDAGVLDDDSPDIVHRLTFDAPTVTGVDALVLVVEAA